MRKLFFAFIMMLSMVSIFAQTKDSLPSFKYTGSDFSPGVNKFVADHEQLDVFIGAYLSKNHFYLHDSLCNKGITLVKFKIDASSHVVNLSCSETTPALLASALKNALQASEKYWKQARGKESGWILQPVLYDYHTKCKSIKNDFYSIKGGVFKFDDDTEVSNMECLILNPLVTSSGVEEPD